MAIFRNCPWRFRLLVANQVALAIQVEQEQFADGRTLTDAVKRRSEYNLIPFPPTLQYRVGSISVNFAGKDETCERGEETQFVNQQ